MDRLARFAQHLNAPSIRNSTAGSDDLQVETAEATTRREHMPGEMPLPRADAEWVERVTSLHELVPMAKSRLLKQDWEFMRGGSDAEASVRRNRLELDWLSGAVVRLGSEHGVPTPANAFVYAALKLHKDGAQ